MYTLRASSSFYWAGKAYYSYPYWFYLVQKRWQYLNFDVDFSPRRAPPSCLSARKSHRCQVYLTLGNEQQEQTHKYGVELFIHGAWILINGDRNVFFVFGIYILKNNFFFFFKWVEKTLMRKPDWLVSTFLRHFIFDGAVLLIIKLKFFSGNTDFFKQDNPHWLLNTKKGKKMPEKFHLKQHNR